MRMEKYVNSIKVYLNEELIKYRMAVFTMAKSNFRYAKLYRTEDSQSFIDARVNFFEYLGGVPKVIVYDNMKVAVRRFIGPTEKETTETLKKYLFLMDLITDFATLIVEMKI